MPLKTDIKKVLVIGSGPIIIGQASEFDYAGTQACRALREDGIEIVLVNSNPATIMTDKAMADKIYIEPLTLETVKRIILAEQPDSILSGMGGQTGLTLCMQLARDGFLAENNIQLLGASPQTIDKAEDRQIFKDTMEKINQPCIPSEVVNDVESAVKFARQITFPVIVRPAFTLGGSGGGIAENEEQLREICSGGLALSPIKQVLIEKCISGWKEIEFEVIRDSAGNRITVCSMENFDPVGIHTGDSIVVAPAVTLADREYQMLRSAALDIVTELGVEGGCNCQFALHPTSLQYAVIEVNPRVSRSSALASKATGYPIAKVATKIALGYHLDEIVNAVTGSTYAAFEPSLDYLAVKFPKWPFDKFVYAKRELGTQMKATGEVMSMAESFEAGLMKAVRGAEVGVDTLAMPKMKLYADEQLWKIVSAATDERVFAIYELLRRGATVEDIHQASMIDRWFLAKLQNLLDFELQISGRAMQEEEYIRGKKLGFTDTAMRRISGQELPLHLAPCYRMVDTCAGEFAAATPYFYAAYGKEEEGALNEAAPYAAIQRERVIVFGSGPIRIGQGIEFDYASVHCVWALQRFGYEVVIVNNNPETVSTDFDTADRLYFEPLTIDDVMDIINLEQPMGVVVAFGGQTAIKLTQKLAEAGVRIIGTSADSIDMAEDRERFDALLESLNILRPAGSTVHTAEQALQAAAQVGYPVLLRPSYVLGGQNMIIAHDEQDIREYMAVILAANPDNPVLIDKYIIGREIEIDAICDGEEILIPGIMEHIERTGVHSGDSISVYPAMDIDDEMRDAIYHTTASLCKGLDALGLVNIQYILKDNEIFVIEVNPRASRTVPYLSKVTGVPMCDLAVQVSLGQKLRDLGYGTGIYPESPYTAVKVPVFSFEKLTDVDTHLGPEMKSTGEVLGLGKNLLEALYKGLLAAGYSMQRTGGVFVTVSDIDKAEVFAVVKKYADMGFDLYATSGTAFVLLAAGISCQISHNVHRLLDSGRINYIISTSKHGRNPVLSSVRIRRHAVSLGIPCFTSLDTAQAMANSLMSRYSVANTELVDINRMRTEKRELPFVKLQACGNDYILFDCMESELGTPESLAVLLTDRHFGVGGDGIVVIRSSETADAAVRTYNYDGSEVQMGGDALCCAAKYLYDNGLVQQRVIALETGFGIKKVQVKTKNGLVSKVQVNMGKAKLKPHNIPVLLEGDRVVLRKVQIGDEDFEITCVQVGNPNCVIFCANVDAAEVSRVGPLFEMHKLFPRRVNTEFVQLLDAQHLKMRVWERSNGETLACGSGACAAAIAAVLAGYAEKEQDIHVSMAGGEMVINYTPQRTLMTAPVEKVFAGSVRI